MALHAPHPMFLALFAQKGRKSFLYYLATALNKKGPDRQSFYINYGGAVDTVNITSSKTKDDVTQVITIAIKLANGYIVTLDENHVGWRVMFDLRVAVINACIEHRVSINANIKSIQPSLEEWLMDDSWTLTVSRERAELKSFKIVDDDDVSTNASSEISAAAHTGVLPFHQMYLNAMTTSLTALFGSNHTVVSFLNYVNNNAVEQIIIGYSEYKLRFSFVVGEAQLVVGCEIPYTETLRERLMLALVSTSDQYVTEDGVSFMSVVLGGLIPSVRPSTIQHPLYHHNPGGLIVNISSTAIDFGYGAREYKVTPR